MNRFDVVGRAQKRMFGTRPFAYVQIQRSRVSANLSLATVRPTVSTSECFCRKMFRLECLCLLVCLGRYLIWPTARKLSDCWTSPFYTPGKMPSESGGQQALMQCFRSGHSIHSPLPASSSLNMFAYMTSL